jgi:quercetin dioxygenase-like cupin family protein
MIVTPNLDLSPTPFPGILHTTLAGSAQGLHALSVWRQILEPGASTPPHRHDCEEVVMCSAGQGELHLGEGRFTFGPCDTVCIPRNALHQIVNAGAEPLALVAVFSKSPVEVYLPDGAAVTLPWSS